MLLWHGLGHPGLVDVGGGDTMDERSRSRRRRLLVLATCVLMPAGTAAALTASPAKVPAAGFAPSVGKASAASPTPQLVRDVKTGKDTLGSLIPGGPDSIQDYIQ